MLEVLHDPTFVLVVRFRVVKVAKLSLLISQAIAPARLFPRGAPIVNCQDWIASG